jgi:hypothetical protein
VRERARALLRTRTYAHTHSCVCARALPGGRVGVGRLAGGKEERQVGGWARTEAVVVIYRECF